MDTYGNILSTIKNAYLIRKDEVEFAWSKKTEMLIKLLVESGFLSSVKSDKTNDNKKRIIAELKYTSMGEPVLTGIKRISKCSRRLYAPASKIPWTLGGKGITIVSTSKGLMTGRQAKKIGLGGELIGQVW